MKYGTLVDRVRTRARLHSSELGIWVNSPDSQKMTQLEVGLEFQLERTLRKAARIGLELARVQLANS